MTIQNDFIPLVTAACILVASLDATAGSVIQNTERFQHSIADATIVVSAVRYHSAITLPYCRYRVHYS